MTDSTGAPETLVQLIERAQVLQEEGDLKSASRLYRQVLLTEPRNPGVLHLLGTVYHQLGNHRAATWFVEKAIRFSPNSPTYYTTLASAQSALGQTRAALRSLQMASELERSAA